MRRAEILFLCFGLVPTVVGCGAGTDTADWDWPAFNHDSRRSGVTGEHLETPLHEQWTFHAPHKPAPAWPEPALRDIWNRIPKLNPRVTDDRAFHTIAVGRSVFFASSADDKVYALDAATGEISWTFFTGGPLRYAPTFTDGRLIVGSDDGVVYCLNAADGSPGWTHGPPDGTRMLPGNGRMISIRPVRTGIVVEDGIAYVASGLFPTEGVSLSALDAASGAVRWSAGPVDLSPQGYLLASRNRLYVPTGRTAPVVFDRADGRLEGAFPTPHGDGGTFALIDGGNLVSGPGKELVSYDAASRERDRLLTFAGTRMIVDGGRYFLLSDRILICYDHERLRENRREQAEAAGTIRALSDSLEALDKNDAGRSLQSSRAAAIRERISSLERRAGELRNAEHSWKTPTKTLYSMILAGDLLFCGGDGFVAA
ncbi:MAG: PQQ-binding-like beta-propeller repeat protein, partial [Candidatus Latescibacteria bacterium]|nr:PQQ-binding-like beta-propeller repeat protein [Candidatus Latescibacterota bacterium]